MENKFFLLALGIGLLVAICQCRMVERKRYTKTDLRCMMMKGNQLPPEVKGNNTIIMCNCTISLLPQKSCIEYEVIDDEGEETSTTQRRNPSTWVPPTRATSTRTIPTTTTQRTSTAGVPDASTTEIAETGGFTRLSHDDTKEQVFVNGNWYNKDGTTNTPFISSMASTAYTFNQCLHHFNASGCDTTWSQRYWVNSDYYSPGGPIFLETAGEWDAESDINGGKWYQYAYDNGAMMIVLEHRFYGQSFPINNPQISDLWLMTSQQALADAANFIQTYNSQQGLEGSKWVTFGCSYGANLAAWMKLKYPDLVTAAVSSSGPVEAIYDFPGYIQTVSEVIQSVDSGCYDYLGQTFQCMEGFTNGTTTGCGPYKSKDQMKQALNYCYGVDWTKNSLSMQQMYNYLSYPPWASNAPSSKVTSACKQLRASNGADNVQFYGNFMKLSKLDGGCSTSAMDDTNFLTTNEAWQSGAAGWTWQTCNEFGYFMSSDPIRGTFGRNTYSGQVYGSSCSQYGSKFTEQYVRGQVSKSNSYYGGKNPNSRCVIYVHGTWDPWHTQGVTTPKAGNTVIVVPGTEHCGDLGNPPNQAMAAAQLQISKQIATYLADPTC